VALSAIAIIQLLTGVRAQHGATDDWSVIRRFGPLAIVLIPTLLGLRVMTTATVYRAVLRTGEHGWHLFKLGPDEARIAALSAAEWALLSLLGGVPAYLLFVSLTPIFEALPAFNRVTAIVGFIGTVTIDFWITVRLSLAPVQTFAEHRFPFRDYWGLARGRFWRMLVAYAIVAAEVLVFLLVSVGVGFIFGFLTEAVIHWQGGGLVRRLLLWLLVPVLAFLTGVVWVAPLILISACQAYVYRAIRAEKAPAAPAAPAPA
jgi:hypothetical protein